jgi:hypothetical protein
MHTLNLLKTNEVCAYIASKSELVCEQAKICLTVHHSSFICSVENDLVHHATAGCCGENNISKDIAIEKTVLSLTSYICHT